MRPLNMVYGAERLLNFRHFSGLSGRGMYSTEGATSVVQTDIMDRLEQVRMELLKKPDVRNFGSSIKELEDSLDPLFYRN